jgi:hypothetical protein
MMEGLRRGRLVGFRHGQWLLAGYPLGASLATSLPGREASQPRREVVRGLGEPLSQAKLRPKPRPIPVFLARVKKYIYVLRDVPQLRLEGGRNGMP